MRRGSQHVSHAVHCSLCSNVCCGSVELFTVNRTTQSIRPRTKFVCTACLKFLDLLWTPTKSNPRKIIIIRLGDKRTWDWVALTLNNPYLRIDRLFLLALTCDKMTTPDFLGEKLSRCFADAHSSIRTSWFRIPDPLVFYEREFHLRWLTRNRPADGREKICDTVCVDLLQFVNTYKKNKTRYQIA